MSDVNYHALFMTPVSLRPWHPQFYATWLKRIAAMACVLCLCVGLFGTLPASAGVSDDYFDGNIFVLYASNGSLVPPRTSLKESIAKERPSILMFYTDDSPECKDNSLILSQLQAFYRQNVTFIPISVDTLPPDQTYTSQEAPYYYNGSYVPQFLVFDPKGDIVLDHVGQTTYEQIDDQLRDIFELPERPDSFSIERPAFSPSPSADTTFWTAPVRGLEKSEANYPGSTMRNESFSQ